MQERLIDERRNRTSLLNQAHAIVIASELAELVGRTDQWTIAVVGCGKKVFVRYPVGGAVECRNLLYGPDEPWDMLPPDERKAEWYDRHMFGGRDEYQYYLFGDIPEKVITGRTDNVCIPDIDYANAMAVSAVKRWLINSGSALGLVSERDVRHIGGSVYDLETPVHLQTANGPSRARRAIEVTVP
jgi:hypothetical protein